MNNPGRLKTLLLQTGLNQDNLPLYEYLKQLGENTNEISNTTNSIVINAGGGGGSIGGIQRSTIFLTDAEIKALPTVYIEVVPAPGSGKYLVVHRYVLQIIASVAYTGVDNTADLNGFTVAYGDWSVDASTFCPLFTNGVIGSWTFFGGAWINVPGATALTNLYPPQGQTLNFSPENLPLKLVAWNNLSGNFTGGNVNNIGKLTTYFTTEAMP